VSHPHLRRFHRIGSVGVPEIFPAATHAPEFRAESENIAEI
jgi:hypothetical protein